MLAVLALGYATVERATLKRVKRTDLTVYLAAAGAVLRGGERLYQVTNERGWHYTMPPLFAVLFAPFGLLPPPAAAALWYALTMGALALSLALIARLVGAHGRAVSRAWWWLPLLVCVDPILDIITRSQLGIVMLALCVLALWLHGEGKPFAAGVVVALATTLKVYSGLLVLCFLRRRDARPCSDAAGFAAFAGAIPAAAFGVPLAARHWAFWFTRVVLPFLQSRDGARPFDELQDPMIAKNQSLYGTLSHLVRLVRGERYQPGPVLKVVVVMASLALVGAIWQALRPRGAPTSRTRACLEWSLPMMFGPAVVPAAWSHYYTLLVFPLAVAVAELQASVADPVRTTLKRSLITVGGLAFVYALTSLIRPAFNQECFALDLVMAVRSAGLFCWAALILGMAFIRILARLDAAPGGRRATR
ncbi:MAG: glycosyltransferase family 87 protein [Planctomycetota bacterium]